MENEIKKINVDGKTYDLGGGGAGQKLISQDDITFNEVITEGDEYIIEFADEDINGKYVNIVIDEVFTELANGYDAPRIKFNNPKNATLTFINTGEHFIDSLDFGFNTFLKCFTKGVMSQEINGLSNYFGEEGNYISLSQVHYGVFTLEFDEFGYLTIHCSGIQEI